ncbi:hypothetical protein HK100_001240 [Physocladia obscura]|uniref:Protein-serine/threonine kinase n=1 Tax=Physocladia obscura TaxID=109957 RepID=A0AAD5XHE5_9FUNG|nr:hypothetical protein HK100_001240 [Physocladia obscura]
MSPVSLSLKAQIRQSAAHRQTQVSLKQMVNFGRNVTPYTLLRSSTFLSRELPIRLAKRISELDSLPLGLATTPSVQRIRALYEMSYADLAALPAPPLLPASLSLNLPPFEADKTIVEVDSDLDAEAWKSPPAEIPKAVLEYNREFTECITTVKTRDDRVALTMAQGLSEVKKLGQSQQISQQPNTMYPTIMPKHDEAAQNLLPFDLRAVLDRFYMSRIGMRFLIGQHIALAKTCSDPASTTPGYVGIINTRVSIREVVARASQNAHTVLQATFPNLTVLPEIKLYIATPASNPASKIDDVFFMYPPSHLHHMLFELFKNSLRATVQRHHNKAAINQISSAMLSSNALNEKNPFPPIAVVVAEGEEDVTIKISDEGGGIPRSGLPLIWSYLYTTANMESFVKDGEERRRTMAGYANQPIFYGHGFGYGIPSARLYARYFGGNLEVVSLEGHGTDVYIHVARLGDNEEPLP